MRPLVVLTAMIAGSAAWAQNASSPAPFGTITPPGIYTTKNPQPAPKKFIFKGDTPFGRATPDALVPAPVGPRTVESAPVAGVESAEATDAIESGELAEAVPAETAPKPPEPRFEARDAAPRPTVLRALNKVTGHAMLMTLKPGETARFGTLTLRALACRGTRDATQRDATQRDAAALIEVMEQKPQEEAVNVLFYGWMLASSPSLSALEHPVYDLSVTKCEAGLPVAKAKEAAPSS